jgi:hypothetical protein
MLMVEVQSRFREVFLAQGEEKHLPITRFALLHQYFGWHLRIDEASSYHRERLVAFAFV